MDDLSIAMKVNLKKDIIQDLGRPKPLTYDQSLETKLNDQNILQQMLDQLGIFSEERQMKVNTTKTSVMKICKSRTVTFPVELKMNDKFLEVKSKLKFVCVILTPNLNGMQTLSSSVRKPLVNKEDEEAWAGHLQLGGLLHQGPP